MQITSIHACPIELVEHLCGFLSYRDVISLSAVDRFCRENTGGVRVRFRKEMFARRFAEERPIAARRAELGRLQEIGRKAGGLRAQIHGLNGEISGYETDYGIYTRRSLFARFVAALESSTGILSRISALFRRLFGCFREEAEFQKGMRDSWDKARHKRAQLENALRSLEPDPAPRCSRERQLRAEIARHECYRTMCKAVGGWVAFQKLPSFPFKVHKLGHDAPIITFPELTSAGSPFAVLRRFLRGPVMQGSSVDEIRFVAILLQSDEFTTITQGTEKTSKEWRDWRWKLLFFFQQPDGAWEQESRHYVEESVRSMDKDLDDHPIPYSGWSREHFFRPIECEWTLSRTHRDLHLVHTHILQELLTTGYYIERRKSLNRNKVILCAGEEWRFEGDSYARTWHLVKPLSAEARVRRYAYMERHLDAEHATPEERAAVLREIFWPESLLPAPVVPTVAQT